MKNSKCTWSLGLCVAVLACVLLLGAVGCKKESAEPTKPAAAAVKVVNTSCPVMGEALDPAKVTEGLTRTFQEQKVGFCCKDCLGSWDKLNDADKLTKLAAAK